jgi:hypothetical protein
MIKKSQVQLEKKHSTKLITHDNPGYPGKLLYHANLIKR